MMTIQWKKCRDPRGSRDMLIVATEGDDERRVLYCAREAVFYRWNLMVADSKGWEKSDRVAFFK